MRNLLFFIVGLLLIGCKTYSDEEKQAFDQQIRDYLKQENIDCERSDSGLYFKILEPGEGDLIQFKDLVSFKYKGTLLDGTVIDEQLEEPVEFQVNELIGAWKEIMLQLRKGGKAFLVAPPQIGYGDHKLNDIPQNSILVFEMEVVDVK